MPIRRPASLLLCLAAATLLALHPDLAFAVTAVPDPAADLGGAARQPGPSAFGRFTGWILDQQRAFHRELTQGLRSLGADGGLRAGLGLILASFLYGVFHAAGPGHGKAVIATYLLTHRERVARGVWLSAVAAFCQGLTAIALVYGLIGFAGWLPSETSAAVAWSERASYALVFLLGAFLAVRAAKRLASALAGRTAAPFSPRVPDDPQDHHHGHALSCGDHAHVPSVEQIESATDGRTALGLILSIGLRPCSGAILVLLLARIMGLDGVGVAAVAAMSTGTALAVAILALLAVSARQWAASIGGKRRNHYRMAADAVALAGGILVMAIGITLITASFAPPHPLASF